MTVQKEGTEEVIAHPEARYSLMRALSFIPVATWLHNSADVFQGNGDVGDLNIYTEILNELLYGTVAFSVMEDGPISLAKVVTVRLPSLNTPSGIVQVRGKMVVLQVQLGSTPEMLRLWDEEHGVINVLHELHTRFPPNIHDDTTKLRVVRGSQINIADPTLGFFPKQIDLQ